MSGSVMGHFGNEYECEYEYEYEYECFIFIKKKFFFLIFNILNFFLNIY